MRYIAIALVTLFSSLAVAQAPAATASDTEAWSPPKSIGMYAYPKNQQNADQQLKDESQCYGAAQQQTGFNPQTALTAQQQNAEQQEAAQKAAASTPKGGTVKGGAGGAAGGAAIGAIAAMRVREQRLAAPPGRWLAGQQKKAESAAKNQGAQQATAQNQAALDSFRRSFPPVWMRAAIPSSSLRLSFPERKIRPKVACYACLFSQTGVWRKGMKDRKAVTLLSMSAAIAIAWLSAALNTASQEKPRKETIQAQAMGQGRGENSYIKAGKLGLRA